MIHRHGTVRRRLLSIALAAVFPLTVPGCVIEDSGEQFDKSEEQTMSSSQALSSVGTQQWKWAPNGTAYFGSAVAVDGDTAVVGARNPSSRIGSVYVYTRNATGWAVQDRLVPSDGAASFGQSVWISDDMVVVGAPDQKTGQDSKGAAYVFVRNNGVWTEQQRLVSNSAVRTFNFGQAVASAGDTIFVGAPNHGAAGPLRGILYIFRKIDGVWTETQKLRPQTASTQGLFGYSIAMDHDTAVVSAPGDDAIYTFSRNADGWFETSRIVADADTAGGLLGSSVALSGNTMVAGASQDQAFGIGAGSALIYVRNGTSWTREAKLWASDGTVNQFLGTSVSIDENIAVIGAPFDPRRDVPPGAAYVFRRNGSTWAEERKLVASDGARSDALGISAALSGSTVVVGANHDDDHGTDSGSAYVFTIAAAQGDGCNGGSDCESGFCVDGVCCDSACSGTCEACTAALKGQGSDGTCGPVAYDTDRSNECWNGACDGNGACKSYDGLPCTSTAECLSDYCVDGFCCNNLCMETCLACSSAKKGSGFDGFCGPIANGTDPDEECSNGTCDGAGMCQ